MEHQEFESPEALRDSIVCFWYTKMDFGEGSSSFEVVPDGHAEIIFHFGGGCSIDYHGERLLLPSPFMVGLLNKPVRFYTNNCLEVIAVRCFPWTVFDLLGLPAGSGSIHQFDHPIAQLQSGIEECMHDGRIADAVEVVKAYFLQARLGIAPDSMLSKAGIAMLEANGTMPVSQVAAAAHATVRTLERRFKQSSGHSVKDVSGIMRFEQVRNHLWEDPDANLARLAVDLGYTDQSHLSREFKRYSGVAPGAFARKTKKGKLAFGDDFVAFVQG